MNMATAIELTFAQEPLAGIRESDLDALLRAHHAEVAHDKDVFDLDPDWEEYFRAEAQGRFVAFTLRRGLSLVGYNAFYVIRSMHYRKYAFAVNDVVYLKPEERGLDGLRLLVESEKQLRLMNVAKVFYHVKVDAVLGSPAGDSLEAIEERLELEDMLGVELPDFGMAIGDRTLGGVLESLGYSHFENHFGKLLKERE